MSALKKLGIAPLKADSATAGSSALQEQTSHVFGFKWKQRASYESETVRETARRWLLNRYCDGKPEQLDMWLARKPQIILDAGCGVGFSALLLFGDHLKYHDYIGIEISEAVDIARQRFAEQGYPGDFLRSDLMQAPIPDSAVDMVFSEGVLHHTDNTGEAIRHLATKLKKGGLFLFYVYAKKSVIREFTDDHVREYLKTLSDKEAWNALIPLTRLGEALGKLNVCLNIPEDIPFLGITKGEVDLQRFFYYHVIKAFYREDFSLEEMNHINFDWFRPLNCHRHTPEEVRTFCREAGLAIERFHIEASGITVVARKL